MLRLVSISGYNHSYWKFSCDIVRGDTPRHQYSLTDENSVQINIARPNIDYFDFRHWLNLFLLYQIVRLIY